VLSALQVAAEQQAKAEGMVAEAAGLDEGLL
jgi:hypothetical protein